MKKVREMMQFTGALPLLDRPQAGVHCAFRDVVVDDDGKVYTGEAAPIEETITDEDIVADAIALRDKIARRCAERWKGTTVRAAKVGADFTVAVDAPLSIVK
jgi:hypothetical protein